VKTRFAFALAGALAAAWLAATPAWANEPRTGAGYSYAGLVGTRGVHGIAGVLSAVDAPVVRAGHVAAWVGLGGRYEGPGGADEWLQVGLNTVPGTGNRLYYEYARPGDPITYVEVDSNVATGRTVRVMVLEMAGHPNTWRVWVDGRPVSAPILLPGSTHRLTPFATSEDCDPGEPAANSYTYRFDGLRTASAPGGVWRPFVSSSVRQDAGNRVLQSTTSSFVASVGVGAGASANAAPSAPPPAAKAQPCAGQATG
jgi:hypothetical protein